MRDMKKCWFYDMVAKVKTNHTTEEVCQAIYENGSYDLSEMTRSQFRAAAKHEDMMLDFDFDSMSIDELAAYLGY